MNSAPSSAPEEVATGVVSPRKAFPANLAALRLQVDVPEERAAVRIDEPVTAGVPLPKGLITDESRIGVTGPSGPIPVQATVLERWADGSIRWVLLDLRACAPQGYAVQFACPPAPVEEALSRRHNGEDFEVETGGMAFRIPAAGEFLLEAKDPVRSGSPRVATIALTSPDGALERPIVSSVGWELTGPLRSVLRVESTIGAGQTRGLEITARLHFYAGLKTVRFELTLRNPARAEHPGGFWELGDRGSVFLRDCSLQITTAASPSVLCSESADQAARRFVPPLELYQDSSGGENWNSPAHVNRDGLVSTTFRGYRLKVGDATWQGMRATPVVWIEDGDTRTGVAMRHFWQNAPKSLEVTDDGILLRLFPRQFADLHELQGGEQKTHVFHVAFGTDGICPEPLDWARRPALARADSGWYCEAAAMPYLTPMAEDPTQSYVDLVHSIVDGPESFERKREIVDEFGWRHFGDIYADHEAVFDKGPGLFISHYNNQYDGVAGFAIQFLRSAEPRWWRAMEELAWHVRDIDIYHTKEDKSAYSGGLFWHTFHYVGAGRSSHRSYPRANGVCGGGPANEHVYSTGLMLHYLLTGEAESRNAAVGLAEWVLRVDDGRLTPFRWLSQADTGLASKTHSIDYHGPGRGAGNAIVTLLNAHRLTGREEFRDKAETLIRRCIHPGDDIERRDLLDAERRWSYTVFLQALGKYLDEKINRGEIDEQYSYAQQSLLHYARWMLKREYLYLEKPEILEYPTETWAAQDVRKSDVFNLAAKHGTPAERAKFRARADYFLDGAMGMLRERPTRYTARPRVLLMICGYMSAAFQTGAEQGHAPSGKEFDFGVPASFTPQKLVARRRFIRIGMLGLVSTVAVMAFVLLALFGG